MSEKYLSEKRTRTRVAVRDELIVAHEDTVQAATLIDISRAGAKVMTQGTIGEGTEVKIHFPVQGADEVIVCATVLRERYFGPGKFVSSLRYIEVESPDRRYFDAILDLYLREAESTAEKLAAEGKGRRRQPKPTRRVVVDNEMIGELRGAVSDVSKRTLTLLVGGDFAFGDRVELVVPDAARRPMVVVKGRVIRHRQRKVPTEDGSAIFELDVEFEELTEEQVVLLKTVVQVRPS